MLPVKANFNSTENRIINEKDMICPLCQSQDEDDQYHLYQCIRLKQLVPELQNSSVNYDDIYSKDIKRLKVSAKLLQKVMNKRATLI